MVSYFKQNDLVVNNLLGNYISDNYRLGNNIDKDFLVDELPIIGNDPIAIDPPIIDDYPVINEPPIIGNDPIAIDQPIIDDYPVINDPTIIGNDTIAIDQPIIDDYPPTTEPPTTEPPTTEPPTTETTEPPNGESPNGEPKNPPITTETPNGDCQNGQGRDFEGTAQVDNEKGTKHDDTLKGGGGNDILSSLECNDSVEGNGGNDIINGGSGVDILIGGADGDTLTGGLDADTFYYPYFSDSLLANFDHITDLEIGKDIIVGPNIVLASAVKQLGNVNLLTEKGIQAELTQNSFAASGAATFTVGNETFLALNDGIAGFQAANDSIIKITGFQGNLSDLAITAAHKDNQVTLSGTILWTDGQGKTHSVRESTVKIWDKDNLYDEHIGTVKTDINGQYAFTFNNYEGSFRGNRDIYIEVLADGPAHYVEDGALIGEKTYSQKSPTLDEISDGKHNLKLTIKKTHDAEHAFSVSDALYVGSVYAEAVRGGAPSILEANFPVSGISKFSHTLFDRDININSDDRWDWDVILHEYGHYLADADNLDNNPGGEHTSGSNIPKLGFDSGVRLAWSEGLATYLGIAAEHVAKTSGKLPNVKNAGDTTYHDTIDYNINDSLETESNLKSQGEGDEDSVMRILWDIADSNADSFKKGLKDEISLGHKGLYKIFKDIPSLDRLSDLWNHFVAFTGDDRQLAKYGAIFEEYNVSPSPTNIKNSYTVGNPLPTFTWEKGNKQQSKGANDLFRAWIFDANFEPVEVSGKDPLKNVTSWTPTQNQWDKVTSTPGDYHFVITGIDSNSGQQQKDSFYWSGAYKFTVLPKVSKLITPNSGGVNLLNGGTTTGDELTGGSGANTFN
ncbi:MAG: calcium-binding protein, partial [Xenococcus sp. (in: cyanobacteria)]